MAKMNSRRTTHRQRTLPEHVSITPSGIYRYRRRVPEKLIPAIGKREIKRSLGKDYEAAIILAAKLNKDTERLFVQAELQKPKSEGLINDILVSKGIALESLERRAEGVDPYDDDDLAFSYWFDAQVEEIIDEGKLSAFSIRQINKGKLPVTLETALRDYTRLRIGNDPTKDHTFELRVDRSRKLLERALGVKLIAESPLAAIKRVHANKVRDEALKVGKPSTAKRMINIISAAVNEAINEGDLDIRNPFQGLKVKQVGFAKDDRLPFTDADMLALEPRFRKQDDLGLIWALLRDTGARQGEITGLRHCDLSEANCCISIVAHEGRTLKTGNSQRDVPIPQGLLEALLARRKGPAADAPVFPKYALQRGPDACSAALMRRVRGVTKDPKKVVYSLRHRMKDKLRDTSCPESLAREIMGHSGQGVASNYGQGTSLRIKREALEKVWDDIGQAPED